MMLIRKDIVSLGLLALFAAVNGWLLIPVQVVAEGSDATYPRLLNGALVILLILYGLEILRSRRAGGKTLGVWRLTFPELGRILGLLACIGEWAGGLDAFGFLPPTAVFLGLTAWLYGERSPWKLVVLMVASPLALYAAFTLLGSALPQGPLEQLLSPLLIQ